MHYVVCPAQIAAVLTRLCLGAGVGILTGIVGGFIAGLYRNLADFLNPLVVFFNAISGIVWLPLMIGWLGIGTALAVFVIWNTVFFIVFQNTVLGVQLVPGKSARLLLGRDGRKIAIGIVLILLVVFGQKLYGMATVASRLDSSLRDAAEARNVIVVLDFMPDRFHNERIAAYGTFAGRD